MHTGRKIEIERVARVRNCLGEGIVWHPPTNAICWLDVYPHCTLYSMELSSGTIRSRSLESNLYCLRNCRDGTLVGLSKHGLARLDPRNLRILETHRILAGDTRYRFNDANCDSSGRLWTGTMIDNLQIADGETPELDFTGWLVRIDGDAALAKMDDGFGCPNTFAWSPDERTMYCADSCNGWLYAYDFDAVEGTIGGRRRFFKDAEAGIPDGSAIDVEGCLWNARWGGSAVIRVAPDGKLVDKVELPVTNVTDCAFAGADLGSLFVTTARFGVTARDLVRQPLAGDVFRISVPVAGMDKGTYAYP